MKLENFQGPNDEKCGDVNELLGYVFHIRKAYGDVTLKIKLMTFREIIRE